MSNIIILSLLSLGLVTSFSFIYSLKNEFKYVDYIDIEGSENLTSKTINNPGNFHSIDVSDQIKVIISQSEESSVEVSAEDNLIDFIQVMNNDGILTIYKETEKHEQIIQKLPMIVRISNPDFRELTCFRQSEIVIEKGIEGSELRARLHDQSSIRGKMNFEKMDITLYQQSNVNVNGKVQDLSLNLRDQSSLRAGNLEVDNLDLEIRNQTRASVNVRSSIRGNVGDQAELDIKGNPAIRDITKSRMAKVN